jgi:hypothetical protein
MAKFNGQLPLLLGSRIEPEFVGPLCYHTPIVTQLGLNNNGQRVLKRPHRLRTQKAATGIGKERKQAAIKLGRNGADAVRETRIDGKTTQDLALALGAPFHFATSLEGRRVSMHSFNGSTYGRLRRGDVLFFLCGYP